MIYNDDGLIYSFKYTFLFIFNILMQVLIKISCSIYLWRLLSKCLIYIQWKYKHTLQKIIQILIKNNFLTVRFRFIRVILQRSNYEEAKARHQSFVYVCIHSLFFCLKSMYYFVLCYKLLSISSTEHKYIRISTRE